MAVLGVGGVLRLQRELPEPVFVHSSAVSRGSCSLLVRNQGYWTGDEVTLINTRGLPFDLTGAGPSCPDGYAVYAGSDWLKGLNRFHVNTDESKYYSNNNDSSFYLSEQDVGITATARYYVYRDQLDRLSFYATKAAAMSGAAADRISIANVDFGSLLISITGTQDYESALTDCVVGIGDYAFSDAQDEVSLKSVCDYAPDYLLPTPGSSDYDNADVYPRLLVSATEPGRFWCIQCMLTDWSLNLSAPEVDISAVGDRFGDSVKSIVTGGGSMDFVVDRTHVEGEHDSTSLMRLLLMTEKGCKSDAQFWMIRNAVAEESGNVLAGHLYYETSILVTSIAINVRATDLIAGSLNFVTVGEIALKMGTN